MARRSIITTTITTTVTVTATVLLGFIATSASAFLVAPGSPCTRICQQSSIKTVGATIDCAESSYAPDVPPQEFRSCVSCLEQSAYVGPDGQTDQQWYLYNLRYAFNYCIFAFPNATGVGLGPCMTSTACGLVEDALVHGIVEGDASPSYEYCSVSEGSVIPGQNFDRCVACVDAGYLYMSNFLTALRAGCAQRPADGRLVAVSGSVFTPDRIAIAGAEDEQNKPRQGLPAGAIAAIVVCAVLLIAVAVAFFLYRRYRARHRGQDGDGSGVKSGGNGGNGGPIFPVFPALGRGLGLGLGTARRHRSESPLDFQCRSMRPGASTAPAFPGERYRDNNALSAAATSSTVRMQSPDDAIIFTAATATPRGTSHMGTSHGPGRGPGRGPGSGGAHGQPPRLTTTALPLSALNPAVLSPAHSSSTTTSSKTPSSTHSYRTTTDLLPPLPSLPSHRPYNPADYAGASTFARGPVTPTSPASTANLPGAFGFLSGPEGPEVIGLVPYDYADTSKQYDRDRYDGDKKGREWSWVGSESAFSPVSVSSRPGANYAGDPPLPALPTKHGGSLWQP